MVGFTDIFLWIVVITFVAGVGGTGLGGVVSACIRRNSNKTVSLLLSFAAGIMLAVVCFNLIFDAMFPEGTLVSANLGPVAIGITLGYGVVALLNFWIDRNTNHEIPHVAGNHPKTADDLDELIHSDHYLEHEKENSNLFVAGVIMAAAIALHNLPEGMVIGAAYAGGSVETLWSGGGLLVAVVIGLHNVPEGMAVAVPLIAGGMKRWKAILVTAASGLPTVLGAMLGFWLGSMGMLWHILSLSFASGAMLYVVFGELFPEAILMWRSKLPALAAVAGLVVGMVIIFL